MTQVIDALIFGVFGTIADWRGQAARAVTQALPQVDPWAFADAWRGEYQFRWYSVLARTAPVVRSSTHPTPTHN